MEKKRFIPSVTRVLKDMGYIRLDGIPLEALETKRQLGISVHDLCARIARGQKIDLSKYQGPIRERAERFLWWLDFTKAKVMASEYKLETGMCRGRLDLLVDIAHSRWVIEIKPTFQEWHRLQLAAYSAMGRDAWGESYRAVLPLDSSKTPKQVPCDDEGDFLEWGRCLLSWRFRYRNGFIKVEK